MGNFDTAGMRITIMFGENCFEDVILPMTDKDLNRVLELVAQGMDPATASYVITSAEVPAWCPMIVDEYDDIRMVNYLAKILDTVDPAKVGRVPVDFWTSDYPERADLLLQLDTEQPRWGFVETEMQVRAAANYLHGEPFQKEDLPQGFMSLCGNRAVSHTEAEKEQKQERGALGFSNLLKNLDAASHRLARQAGVRGDTQGRDIGLGNDR